MKQRYHLLRGNRSNSNCELSWLLFLTTSFCLTAAIVATESETFLGLCVAHADLLKPLFFLFGYTLVLGHVIVLGIILDLNRLWETSLRVAEAASVSHIEPGSSHSHGNGQIPKTTEQP